MALAASAPNPRAGFAQNLSAPRNVFRKFSLGGWLGAASPGTRYEVHAVTLLQGLGSRGLQAVPGGECLSFKGRSL